MRSYIVTGEKKVREDFISDFIKKEGILEYSVNFFSEEVKIDSAKEVRKILSKKYSEKTLVVIQNINIVAQNALLKSIEEISENICLIVSVDDLSGILDTIKSRLFTVELKTGEILPEKKKYEFGVNFSEILVSIDKFLLDHAELESSEQMSLFIKEYRKSFLERVSNFTNDEIKFHLNSLKRLLGIANFVKSNNVNLRFALESTIY